LSIGVGPHQPCFLEKAPFIFCWEMLILFARDNNLGRHCLNIFISSVGCAMTNYSVYEVVLKKYVSGLRTLAESNGASSKFADLVAAMSDSHQVAFFKAIFRSSVTGEEAFPVLHAVPEEKLRPVCAKIIFSRSSFAQTETFSKVVCFLNLALTPDNFVKKVFLPVLALWADPVIARAYVKSEVVHYSKLIFIVFTHLSEEVVSRFQSAIVEGVGCCVLESTPIFSIYYNATTY